MALPAKEIMKTKNTLRSTTKRTSCQDTFIREVRATYHMTGTQLFAITGPDDVAAFIRSVLTDNSREHFIALYLDGSHQVVSYSTISIGTANKVVVHPREIFQRAILAGAIGLVVAHNHPSGNLSPSEEDHAVTRAIRDAGEIIGIRLLDHLIMGDRDYRSIITETGIH